MYGVLYVCTYVCTYVTGNLITLWSKETVLHANSNITVISLYFLGPFVANVTRGIARRVGNMPPFFTVVATLTNMPKH